MSMVLKQEGPYEVEYYIPYVEELEACPAFQFIPVKEEWVRTKPDPFEWLYDLKTAVTAEEEFIEGWILDVLKKHFDGHSLWNRKYRYFGYNSGFDYYSINYYTYQEMADIAQDIQDMAQKIRQYHGETEADEVVNQCISECLSAYLYMPDHSEEVRQWSLCREKGKQACDGWIVLHAEELSKVYSNFALALLNMMKKEPSCELVCLDGI